MNNLFAISNISWSGESDDEYLKLISGLGVNGVELAASIIWDEPLDSTYSERESYRKKIESYDLKISGLHALLFSRPDLQLLSKGDERKRVVNYLKGTSDLCSQLGGEYMVLGSGKNRLRGNLSYKEGFQIAVDILKEIGDYAHSKNVIITIESLPPPGCDFIQNLKEALDLVKAVNSPGVKLHFDTGSADMTENIIDGNLPALLKNVFSCQVNDFELLPPGSTKSNNHSIWSQYLKQASYRGWISIEMRRSKNPKHTIPRVINYVQDNYLI